MRLGAADGGRVARKEHYLVGLDVGTSKMAAIVAEAAFDYLDAPVKRIGAADVPIPFSPTLEGAAIPHSETIVDAVRALRGKIWR